MRALRTALALALLVAAPGCDGCRGPHGRSGDAAGVAEFARVLDDAAMGRAIADARTRADAGHRRVLLVFVGGADDEDSRLVARMLGESPASAALARGYERVWVNVGTDLSRHAMLRHAHDVAALATLVVLDAATGRRVARRTFSPATGRGTVTSATLAAWLDDPRGR